MKSGNSKMKLKPLFKWAGGKRSLLPHLLSLAPKTFSRYHEPFLGSGALFFALRPEIALLSDRNHDLVNCYQQIRDSREAVIRQLQALRNSEEAYYALRSSKPLKPEKRAARFLYLTTLSFNGLYRLNLKGKFNVPYGHKTHLSTCDSERLSSAAEALKKANIQCMDFGYALRRARRDDFIYVDPPYTVAHGNNGFIKYNAKIFSWADQKRLATLMLKLAERGCHVMVSNADHESIRELYTGFKVHTVTRTSVMAADSSHRLRITECIFTSY